MEHTPTARRCRVRYRAAVTELEDTKLLLSVDTYSYRDFDENLAEDAEETIEVLNELQTISTEIFPSRPCHFTLRHHNLSPNNLLVDQKTYKVTETDEIRKEFIYLRLDSSLDWGADEGS